MHIVKHVVNARFALTAIAASAAVAATVAAGQPAQRALAFEVASIKRQVAERPVPGTASPDRFYRVDITLRALVQYAYLLPDFQVVGGPAWTATDRFEVNAKAAAAPTRTAMRQMMQRLLQDRFALKTHTETRELPIYELVVARADRRLGPNLKPAQFDCERFYAADRPLRQAGVDENTTQRCSTRFTLRSGVVTETSTGRTLARLVSSLQSRVGRAVVDRTGLAGSFDFELTYSDEGLSGPSSLPAGATRREGPAILTAVQEQLGLRLVSSRGPVEVLVIDSATPPDID